MKRVLSGVEGSEWKGGKEQEDVRDTSNETVVFPPPLSLSTLKNNESQLSDSQSHLSYIPTGHKIIRIQLNVVSVQLLQCSRKREFKLNLMCQNQPFS